LAVVLIPADLAPADDPRPEPIKLSDISSTLLLARSPWTPDADVDVAEADGEGEEDAEAKLGDEPVDGWPEDGR
jgi:hypothetical protein